MVSDNNTFSYNLYKRILFCTAYIILTLMVGYSFIAAMKVTSSYVIRWL